MISSCPAELMAPTSVNDVVWTGRRVWFHPQKKGTTRFIRDSSAPARHDASTEVLVVPPDIPRYEDQGEGFSKTSMNFQPND